MKAKIVRTLNFHALNFIPEENKHEMDMQKTYIWTSRSHSFRTILVLMCADILAKLHPTISSCISLWVFSYKLLQYFENIFFLKHLCTMASISSIEKDFIATSRDSFKNCILTCKISNEMYTNFEKWKVPQAASSNFVKKWLFCKMYVLHNICFFVCGQNSWKARSK